jgi:hypothetical protein
MKMSSRAALGAIAIAAMLGLTQSACAIGQDYKKEVLSGKPTRLLTFLNCTSHTPYYGTAFVDHGVLAYKATTQRRCGNASEPVREVWYTSPPGYKGTDTVTFSRLYFPTIYKIVVH